MKKIALLFCFSLFFSFVHAGLVDSVSLYKQNGHQYLYVEGEFGHTGVHITRVTYSLSYLNDLVVRIYLKICPGWQLLTPYDTTISLGDSLPTIENVASGVYLIRVYMSKGTITSVLIIE